MSSSSRTNPLGPTEQTEQPHGRRVSGGWTGAARNPWAVLCAVATVVLGPAAVTASALDQANRAPLHHHAVRADPTQQAYIPSDLTRRRGTAA
ncbi:hypothetical protein OG241_15050 [Streptomyces sp. NBC_01390]|uniref:hypothetical protein n=1 Tax=Streptomyces sp. NBC_01390 TaxID=2903850 RepID=UPI003245A0D4